MDLYLRDWGGGGEKTGPQQPVLKSASLMTNNQSKNQYNFLEVKNPPPLMGVEPTPSD